MQTSPDRVSRRTAIQATAALALGSTVGSTTGRAETDEGELVWSFDRGFEVWSSPTVVDGTVFIGTDSQDGLHALDAASGEVKWTFGNGSNVWSSPTVADGMLFAGDHSGRIFALDTATGEQDWSVETDGRVISSPTVTDTDPRTEDDFSGVTVFVGSFDGHLYALDAATGEERWKHQTSAIQSSPTVVDGTVYFADLGGTVYALDALSGDVHWTFEAADDVYSSPTVTDGLVVIGSNDASVYALDIDDGTSQWAFETGGRISSSPTVASINDGTDDGADNQVAFVGSADGAVYALEVATGNELWSFETGDEVQSSPTVAGDSSTKRVFVGSQDRHIYAIDATNGEQRWSFETDRQIRHSSPTVTDGKVFIGCRDGSVYAINTVVEGASVGSRTTLGTLGHHEEMIASDVTIKTGSQDTSADDGSTADDTTSESETDGTDPDQSDDSTDEEVPGFGIGTAIASLGGAGYLLWREIETTNPEE